MRVHYIAHACSLTIKDSSSGEGDVSGWGVSHGGSLAMDSTVDNASSNNYTSNLFKARVTWKIKNTFNRLFSGYNTHFFCVLVCISVGHKPGLESVASILSIR